MLIGTEDPNEIERSLKRADVVLAVFSINNVASLSSLDVNWAPILKNTCPKTPTLLVGAKMDLRTSQNVTETTTEEHAKRVAKNIGSGLEYVECSSLTMQNTEHVFELVSNLSYDRAAKQLNTLAG